MVFASCFVPSGMLMRHFLLRRQKKSSLRHRILANLSMSAASWLFVVELPMAIIAWELLSIYVLDGITTVRADPISWISVLVLSALVGALAEAAVLRAYFRRELRVGVGLLFAIDIFCVAGSAYATVKYVLAHPPIT